MDNRSFPPVVEEISPAIEPWQAFLCVASCKHPLFFDSALSHSTLGRYSYVMADPCSFISCKGDIRQSGVMSFTTADIFYPFRPRYPSDLTRPLPGLPPFQGGAAGLFGYDLCHHIEKLPRPRSDEFMIPDLAVGFYDWVIAFDHQQHRSWIISTGYPEHSTEFGPKRARQRLEEVRKLLADPRPRKPESPGTQSRIQVSPQYPLPQLPGLTSNFTRQGYVAAVRRAIDYINAGDCFQVNLSQRLLYPSAESPVDLYLRLRQRNPSTFGGYFDLGDFVIASASPERFIKLDCDGSVETRPIKGTRPRGKTPEEDHRNVEALLASGKDRAENIMIVDLLRNDLGRVCEYGSIHVPSLCAVESYETVHHLVSTVRGRLRKDQAAVDLLRAAFPGGSVTGAPKVRAMEIIAELEPTARGPYCGCLGYIGFDGSMDTNILIRTFTIGKGWVQFPVGGGIVADSDPEKEYEETLDKAEGMIRALQ